jgi:uncharacterized protein (TIRG00374 family)
LDFGVFAVILGIFTFTHVMVSLRWWLLLRTQSIFIGFWAAVRLYFLGWFYNNFMPSSVGGDLVRAWYVTRHTDKRFEAALSVFVDRAIGLLSTLLIAVFFYSVFLANQGEKIGLAGKGGFLKLVAEQKWIIFWVVLAVASIFCGLLLLKRGRAILRKVWSYIRARGLVVIRKLKDATIIYCSRPLTILGVFVLTICMQIMAITALWILGVNMGIGASVKYYYVFFTLMWVVAALPVSIGGAVVMEGGLVYLFTQFAGVEAESALALALCQRIVWMITSLPGAAIHLIGAHLPPDPKREKKAFGKP